MTVAPTDLDIPRPVPPRGVAEGLATAAAPRHKLTAPGGQRRIAWALAGIVLGLFALWVLTWPPGGLPFDTFAMRPAMLQGTGSLALGVMSVAMLLSTRPVVFEPWAGGLDKLYRLHRWLGIAGLGLAVAHWLWVEAPKALGDLGWVVRPARVHAAAPDNALLLQLHGWRGAAEAIGEWAFYALVALLVFALMKQLPYRRFFQLHRLMPVVYLALVFHAVVLTKDTSWTQPLGVVMGALMAAGTASAVLVLFGRVGRQRQALAVVESSRPRAGVDVLEVTVQMEGRWPGHDAGQFAFVRFDASEGAHPFTITSPWRSDGRMVFLIKALGDYTSRLPALLSPGDRLRVEGPYGQFNFEGRQRRQVWVGGGIGITPFLARLQHLALLPDGRQIDLFYATATGDELSWAPLRQAARAAHVTLHIMAESIEGRLTAERLVAAVPGWRDADVWFCGPSAFGRQLRRDLRQRGLKGRDFHQELFELR